MHNVSLAGLLGSAITIAALSFASPAVGAQTPIKTTLFKSGFSAPICVTAPPNDFNRLFVVERAGRIKIIKDLQTNPIVLATPFLDISGLTTLTGERGLLSIAFHPNFATNNRYFVYYTNSAGSIVIAEYKASTGNPDVSNTNARILITIPHPSFSNHNGGQIAFGPDGYLYFAPGDGGSGNDPNSNAQNINVYLGKILRVDVDNPAPGFFYGIPATNPYAGATPGLDEIWAQGVRNPFRFGFDRNTGDLVIGDVGQNAVEEIDFLASANLNPPAGQAHNFGWRCFEGTSQTNLAGCTYPNPYSSHIPPIHEYNHGVGTCVIGGVVYRGTAIPDLRGTYFFGDYSTVVNPNKIWSFNYDPVGGKTNFTDRTAQLAPGGGASIVSLVNFGQDAMGEVYLCDMNGGEIFKIVPVNPVLTGVANYGTGTAGCSGAQVQSTNTSPVINNPGFQVRTSNCPASALGLGLATDVADVAGSDPFGIGVLLHVDLFAATSINTFDVVSDALGNGVASAPIPNSPALVGKHFFVQTLSSWTSCVLPPFNLSTSDALDLTIQP